MTTDKLTNPDEVKRFFYDLHVKVPEVIVRKVVCVLTGESQSSLYALYKTRPGMPAICGKGTADKINRLYKEGKLEPYVDYLQEQSEPPTRENITQDSGDGESQDTTYMIPNQFNIDWTEFVSRVRQQKEIPFYVPQKVRLGNRLIGIEDALNLQSCLFVVGPAGAGKTANLRQTQINLLEMIPRQIAVWVSLDSYKPGIGLLGLVQRSLGRYGVKLTELDVDCIFKSNEVVLIMDGWTEVAPANRDQLRNEFRSWRLEYPLHRYLISGRRDETYSISTNTDLDSEGLSTAVLQPFNDADLSLFLSRALGYQPELQKLPPRLKEAARWPLYAKMVAQEWKDKGSVEARFIADLVEHTLERELVLGAGTLPSSFRDEIDEFMTELGSQMHRQLVTVIPRNRARKIIRETWSIFRSTGRINTTEESTIQAVFESPLIVIERNAVRFAHQIFQEYFAGCWLSEELKVESDDCKHLVSDPWWTYPFIFAVSKAQDAGVLLKLAVQSRNIWAISRCLAGEAGTQPSDYCKRIIDSLLAKSEDDRRFAVHCMGETLDDPWVFAKMLNVINEEDPSKSEKEPAHIPSTNAVLNDALSPFLMSDQRLLQLPLQLFADLEELSPTARWAAVIALESRALFQRDVENRQLLVDLLLKASKDTSSRVRSQAITALGELACNEKFSKSGKVLQKVVTALNETSSSGQWPESQEAIEYLVRLGEFHIDEEWAREEIKRTIQLAEASLSCGNTEFGALLAVNFFDEVMGTIICEAMDKLGNEKFEKLLLLALPTASPIDKKDILNHLSRIGSNASISALTEEIVHRPNAENTGWQDPGLAAANALICIGTIKVLKTAIRLVRHGRWDTRLLVIMAMLRLPKPEFELIAKEEYRNEILQCWNDAKGDMLKLMSKIGGGVLYTPKTNISSNPESVTIKPIIDKIIIQLPRAELRFAARDMLAKGVEPRFACLLLGDIGIAEDLPSLHAKLNEENMRSVAEIAMGRIQERSN